jgi:hypothetical protein
MKKFIKLKWTKWIIAILSIFMVWFAVKYTVIYYKEKLVPLTEVAAPFIHNGDGKPLVTVHIGGQYYVRLDQMLEKPVLCEVTVIYYFYQSSIIDGVVHRIIWYPYPSYLTRSFDIGHIIDDRFIVIPFYLKAGEYKLERQADYTCDGIMIRKDASFSVTIIK